MGNNHSNKLFEEMVQSGSLDNIIRTYLLSFDINDIVYSLIEKSKKKYIYKVNTTSINGSLLENDNLIYIYIIDNDIFEISLNNKYIIRMLILDDKDIDAVIVGYRRNYKLFNRYMEINYGDMTIDEMKNIIDFYEKYY